MHHNALWCCFAESGGRDRFVNYDEEVRHIVARFRSEYARHVGDPVWEEDIRRLSERSPEFAELWARHEVAAPAERVRRFRRPQVGLLNLVNTELAVPAEGDLRMSVYTRGMPRPGRSWRSSAPGSGPWRRRADDRLENEHHLVCR